MDFKRGLSKQITKLNMKTSFFLEESKIRTYISTLENDIQELKLRAGELGYTMWTNGTTEEAEMIEIYKQISEKYQIIQKKEEEIRLLQNENEQVLGTTQAVSQTASQAVSKTASLEQVFCSSCGEAYPVSVNFCKNCGTKLH